MEEDSGEPRGGAAGHEEEARQLREVQQSLTSVARSIGGQKTRLQDAEARLRERSGVRSELARLREVAESHSSVARSIVEQEERLQDAVGRLARLDGALASPDLCTVCRTWYCYEPTPFIMAFCAFCLGTNVRHHGRCCPQKNRAGRPSSLSAASPADSGAAVRSFPPPGVEEEAITEAPRVQSAGARGQPPGAEDSGGGEPESPAKSEGSDRSGKRGRGGEEGPGVPAQR